MTQSRIYNKLSALFIFWALLAVAMRPLRPLGVPVDARYSGGMDGGVWIRCLPMDVAKGRYHCTVYQDNSGEIRTIGNYQMNRLIWKDKREMLLKSSNDYFSLMLNGFDGVRIFLSAGYLLEPDGWIDYPFGDGSGKKVLYQNGVEIREEAYPIAK